MNNSTVQTIIDMDKAARQRKADAQAEAQRITEQAEEKRAELIRTAKAKTEAQASVICNEIKAASDKEIEKVKNESDEKCRRLDEIMSRDAETRIDGIIDRIFNSVKASSAEKDGHNG